MHVKDITNPVILGTPFIEELLPFSATTQGIEIECSNIFLPFDKPPIKRILSSLKHEEAKINFLKEEVAFQKLQQQLQEPSLQAKIKTLETKIQKELCADLPTAFWNWKKHTVRLPYEPKFDEKTIPIKARPVQMNHEQTIHC